MNEVLSAAVLAHPQRLDSLIGAGRAGPEAGLDWRRLSTQQRTPWFSG
jgi:hypothetical protein